MKKMITVLAVASCCVAYGISGSVTESLDNWVFGTNVPEIKEGERGGGTTGKYMYLPVGTSAFYYEVMMEGEGWVEYWVYDPGNCLEDIDPGYGNNGPRWGLQSPLYQSLSVGIGRPDYVAGCQGYSPWSTVAPYSYTWFKDGVRGSHGVPFTAGWFKWRTQGTWDDITFTLYDVDYLLEDGPPHDDLTHGDVVQTYDATSFGGMWEALFGEGWKAFYLKGDDPSGIEDIGVHITASDGNLEELPVTKQYARTTWSTIKQLFR